MRSERWYQWSERERENLVSRNVREPSGAILESLVSVLASRLVSFVVVVAVDVVAREPHRPFFVTARRRQREVEMIYRPLSFFFSLFLWFVRFSRRFFFRHFTPGRMTGRLINFCRCVIGWWLASPWRFGREVVFKPETIIRHASWSEFVAMRHSKVAKRRGWNELYMYILCR